MKRIVFSTVFTVIFYTVMVNAQTSLSGREIQQKSIQATRVSGVEAIATMTIIDGRGRKRIRKLAQISKLVDKDQTEKRLIQRLKDVLAGQSQGNPENQFLNIRLKKVLSKE